jgi:hypothetical protein
VGPGRTARKEARPLSSASRKANGIHILHWTAWTRRADPAPQPRSPGGEVRCWRDPTRDSSRAWGCWIAGTPGMRPGAGNSAMPWVATSWASWGNLQECLCFLRV